MYRGSLCVCQVCLSCELTWYLTVGRKSMLLSIVTCFGFRTGGEWCRQQLYQCLGIELDFKPTCHSARLFCHRGRHLRRPIGYDSLGVSIHVRRTKVFPLRYELLTAAHECPERWLARLIHLLPHQKSKHIAVTTMQPAGMAPSLQESQIMDQSGLVDAFGLLGSAASQFHANLQQSQ